MHPGAVFVNLEAARVDPPAALQIAVLKVIAVAAEASAKVEAECDCLKFAYVGLHDQTTGIALGFAVGSDP
jgi:hypothetical protein